MAQQNSNHFTLWFVLEKEKLNGSNYIDWSRNLRIVLRQEKKLYVLDAPVPNKSARNATAVQRETYETKKSDSNDVTCLMSATARAAKAVHGPRSIWDHGAPERDVLGTGSSQEIRDNKSADLLQDDPGYTSEYPRTKDERVFRYSWEARCMGSSRVGHWLDPWIIVWCIWPVRNELWYAWHDKVVLV